METTFRLSPADVETVLEALRVCIDPYGGYFSDDCTSVVDSILRQTRTNP